MGSEHTLVSADGPDAKGPPPCLEAQVVDGEALTLAVNWQLMLHHPVTNIMISPPEHYDVYVLHRLRGLSL